MSAIFGCWSLMQWPGTLSLIFLWLKTQVCVEILTISIIVSEIKYFRYGGAYFRVSITVEIIVVDSGFAVLNDTNIVFLIECMGVFLAGYYQFSPMMFQQTRSSRHVPKLKTASGHHPTGGALEADLSPHGSIRSAGTREYR